MFVLFLLSSLLLLATVFPQTLVCPNDVSISLTKPSTVLENGLVTFSCSVTVPSDLTLPTDASWLKDYITLITADNSRYSTGRVVTSATQVEFSLDILQATVGDSGTYSCDPLIPGSLCRESVNLTVSYALAVIVEDQVAVVVSLFIVIVVIVVIVVVVVVVVIVIVIVIVVIVVVDVVVIVIVVIIFVIVVFCCCCCCCCYCCCYCCCCCCCCCYCCCCVFRMH